MLPVDYPQRRGDYIYEVSVTKDDTRQYRAHLSRAERQEDGRLTRIQVDVPDTVRSHPPPGGRRLECFVRHVV